jgi:hypothetical protein
MDIIGVLMTAAKRIANEARNLSWLAGCVPFLPARCVTRVMLEVRRKATETCYVPYHRGKWAPLVLVGKS